MTSPDQATNNGRTTIAILGIKLDYLNNKVDKIETMVGDDHADLSEVKQTIRILKWGGGALGAITLALGTAWAKQALGL